MIKTLLSKRKLPQLKSKGEMLDLLQKEVYGYLPPPPEVITWTVEENIVKTFCAGHAVLHRVTITVRLNEKDFSFPVYATLPKTDHKVPFFIHINFRSDVPDRYQPTEELIDNGYAVLSFNYKDITADNNDFSDGLAGILYPGGIRAPSDPGKIAIWAWAAQRIMDYAQTLDCLDLSRGIVCGHSRLGKTALLTAATDERFYCAHSNDSGCTGAALSRGKTGETIEKICDRFSYWFCENYKRYIGKEELLPLDQHFLIASIAPRLVSVASASEDYWADPASEYLACVAASAAYPEKGLVHPDRLPEIGDFFAEGSICYTLREGAHYFSRQDWLNLIRFLK